MKKSIIALVLFLSPFLVFAEQTAITQDGKEVILNDDGTWKYAETVKDSDEDFHFRKTRWGMSVEEVKASETAEFFENHSDNETLYYYDYITSSDIAYFLRYYFIEDKLISARYTCSEIKTSRNLYISEYKKLKGLISKKYGEPIQDHMVWKDDLYKDDESDYGFAVSYGDLTYFSHWENEDTSLTLMLQGKNFECELDVEYFSKKHKPLIDTVVSDEEMSDF